MGAKKEYTPYDYWLAAMKNLIKQMGHGSQVRIAEEVGVEPQHISDIKRGVTKASMKVQQKIADAMDADYIQMLKLGKELLAGTEPFPGYFKIVKFTDKADRVSHLLEQIAKEYGFQGFMGSAGAYVRDPHSDKTPDFIQDYYSGKIKLLDLYRSMDQYFASLRKKLIEELQNDWRGEKRGVVK